MYTILIIDDIPVNVLLLEKIVKREGFQVLSANNGPDGRKLAVANKPDLILMDLMMPGESGITTCKILKENSATADIPIIFISADTSPQSKVSVFNSGGVDYITKPFNSEEVIARAKTHIKLSLSKNKLIESQTQKLLNLSEAQKAILITPEQEPDAHFAVYYRSLMEAGGDFYDVLPLAENMFAYICADVCGHDVGVSLATSALKALIHQNTSIMYSLEETVEMINTILNKLLPDDQYVTLCYAQLNRNRNILKIVSAGHPPLIVLRKDGTIDVFDGISFFLGAYDSITLSYHETKVSSGDRFYIYTDGLIEFHDSDPVNRKEGLDFLKDKIKQLGNLPLTENVRGIVEDLIPDDAPVKDDLLLMGVEV